MPKIKLIKRAKVWLNAGETVVVSSADAGFLLAVGSAKIVEEKSGSKITEQIEKATGVSAKKKK